LIIYLRVIIENKEGTEGTAVLEVLSEMELREVWAG
jgi:hypothetical protein